MTEALIRLPYPPSKLSANGSQGDWRGKALAARTYKSTCAWECKAQRVPKIERPVDVQVTFYPSSNRRYDLDNALKKAKQGLDAVAEAIGVDDADWRSITLVRGEKVEGGCMLVHVRQCADQEVVIIPFRGGIA